MTLTSRNYRFRVERHEYWNEKVRVWHVFDMQTRRDVAGPLERDRADAVARRMNADHEAYCAAMAGSGKMLSVAARRARKET